MTTIAQQAVSTSDRWPARVSLKSADCPRGPLNGAWWPRSRDLLRELPALMDALEMVWGPIPRIAVNPLHWAAVPKKVPVHGHIVKVGWFSAEQDEHTLLIRSSGAGRRDLMVVPPQADAATAARLMTAATHSSFDVTASLLIDADKAAVPLRQPIGGSGERNKNGNPAGRCAVTGER